MPQKVDVGVPLPLGAHQRGTGINFSVFSRHATKVSLLLFGDLRDHAPTSTITLQQQSNRSGDIWHLWVEGVGPGSLYKKPGQREIVSNYQRILLPGTYYAQ